MWGGAEPFAEQDGGVVLEVAVVVLQNGVDEAAQGFGDGQAVGVVADEKVDEPGQAEFLVSGPSGFGDAVGVEHDAVAGLQLVAAQVSGETEGGAHGVGGWTVQEGTPATTTDDDWRVMAAVDPRQDPGPGVEVGEDTGGVAVPTVLLDEYLFDLLADLHQPGALTAGVAARAHGEVGGQPGGRVVSHGVEKRQVHHVSGSRVVVGIAADLVCRFHRRRDHHPSVRVRGRGHQTPLHLGSDVQPPGARQPGMEVTGAPLAVDDQSNQGRQQLHVLHSLRVLEGRGDPQDTQTLGAVDQRHPPADLPVRAGTCARGGVGAGGGENLAVLEGAPRHGSLDLQPGLFLDCRVGVDVLLGQQAHDIALKIR